MGESGWVPLIGTVIAALFGSGGLVAFLNWRHQRNTGVRQEDRADDDALSKRAQDLLESQFKMLVQPLQGEVARLRHDLDDVKEQLESQRTRYWRLVAFVRSLRSWAVANAKPDHDPHPEPPPDLAEDL